MPAIPRINCLRNPDFAHLVIEVTGWSNPDGELIQLDWQFTDGDECTREILDGLEPSGANLSQAEMLVLLRDLIVGNYDLNAFIEGNSVVIPIPLSEYPCACNASLYEVGAEIPEDVIFTYRARVECCPGVQPRGCDDCGSGTEIDPCAQLIRPDAIITDGETCLEPCPVFPGFAQFELTVTDFVATRPDTITLGWQVGAGTEELPCTILLAGAFYAVEADGPVQAAQKIAANMLAFNPAWNVQVSGSTVTVQIPLANQNYCACDEESYNVGDEQAGLPPGFVFSYVWNTRCCPICAQPGAFAAYTITVDDIENPNRRNWGLSVSLDDGEGCEDELVAAPLGVSPGLPETPEGAAWRIAQNIQAPFAGVWNGDNTTTIYIPLFLLACACNIDNYTFEITGGLDPATGDPDPDFLLELSQAVECCGPELNPNDVFDELAEAVVLTTPYEGTSYTWTQTFGSTTGVTIVTPNANSTQVTGLGPGLYRFQVEVSREGCENTLIAETWHFIKNVCGECWRALSVGVAGVDEDFIGEIDVTFTIPGCEMLEVTINANEWTAHEYCDAIAAALAALTGVPFYGHGDDECFVFFLPCTEDCECLTEIPQAVGITMASAEPGFDADLYTFPAYTACTNA